MLDAAAQLDALWEAPVGLALFDAELRYVRVNAALAAINGVPAADHVGKTVLEVLPDQNPEVADQLRRVRDTGAALDVEVEGYTPRSPGVRRTWRVSYYPVRDGASVVGVGATVVEITGQKEIEQELRRSEERYRSLFESMTEGFAIGEAICDDGAAPDFRLLEMNDAFERQSGLRRREVEGRPIREVLPRIERAWIDTYCGVALSGKPVRFESYNRDLDRHFSVYCFSPAPRRFAVVFTDVTAQRRVDEALRAAEQRFRSAIENLPSGLIVADLSTRALQWNGEALAIHGYRAEEDEHRFLETLVAEHELRTLDGEPIPVERWPLPRLLNGETFHEYEIVVRNERLGWERIFSYSGVVVPPQAGLAATGLLAIQDVTERKRAEAALRAANDRLREADRRKDEFLGMLSHELRNPLAPIRNALYILDRTDPAGLKAHRAKAVANRQVTHLTRLVDDLLDVTRIARGKVQLHRADTDLTALVRRTAEDHRALMQERGLELAVAIPLGAVVVNADETRLAQVVGNLLQNAAKFTPSGGRVSLSVGVEEDRAVIRVADDGAGIAPEVQGTLFEPFVQAKQTLARSEGGLGLGLALVKGLVASHGGEVAVASEGVGRGAEFVVKLPLAGGAHRAPRAAEGPRPGAARRRRVLVVDDNRDAAETLAELVQLLGHEAETAFDGPSAVEKARSDPPDVVLCDIGLPGMDGYAVAKALRAAHDRRLRLVAVSGYAQPEDLAKAAEAGFDDHIPKPPAPERVERALE
ncbi:hybrid sensor histidine kinase/response regulator [Anaeromyxobacter oryzae]|uniref:histidine kinase n=1 Tax=Anaeromyxobacter oryzae TaxID=2918170 RepID=A0ABM7X478_9BACT|nr:PAS domain S-box protein [Anaeromyxobacter oryzae]BDG06616.1 hypothetical protein AMOR_56120 [Anaeromyxobacter oryzae]